MSTFFVSSQARSYVTKSRRSGPRRVVTKTYKRLSSLSTAMGNSVRLDLVNGIKTFKKKISTASIESAWAKGDYSKVVATIPWDELPKDLNPAMTKIGESANRAAAVQLLALPSNINKNLRFDVSNPRIKHFIKNRTAALVTNITEGTQRSIQNAVARSFTDAMTPKEVAQAIKGSIGLLPQHELAVRNYARGLAREGYPVMNIQKYSAAYADRLLDYRSMMIARTETRFAVNEGQLAIWHEGAAQGFFNGNTATKEWVVDGDPCEICEPMDEVRVGLYDPWLVVMADSVKSVYNPTETHPHCFCGMELHFEESKEEESDED